MEWSPTRDPNEEELELGVQTTEYVARKLYMTEEEKAACTERFEVGGPVISVFIQTDYKKRHLH